MATKRITFKFRPGGVLTDVDFVGFSDPTGTYGVRRSDTEEVIVEAEAVTTLFENIGTGIYVADLEDLDDGVIYDYWIAWTYDGATNHQNGEFTAAGGELPTCYMFTYGEFTRRFGTDNIRMASNKENDDLDVNYTAVQDSMDYAVSFIETRLVIYATPLSVVEPVVKDWAMVVAFENLYNSRGRHSGDTVGNSYRGMVKDIEDQIAMYARGGFRLQADLATGVDFTPIAIASEDELAEYEITFTLDV